MFKGHHVTSQFDKEPSGINQPNASFPALGQEDARTFPQRPDPSADTRLAETECVCRMVGAQIFGGGDRLDEGIHGPNWVAFLTDDQPSALNAAPSA